MASVWCPGVCAVNGLLYVVGGDDGSCNLASVEYYNPATDKWTLLPTNMSTGRSYAGQCAPPTPPHARGTGGKLADLELRASSRIGHSFVLCSLQILIISTCFPNKPECILGSLFFFFLFFPLLCICNQTYPWAQQRRSGPMSQCFYGSLLDQYLPWVGRHWISHCCAEIFT